MNKLGSQANLDIQRQKRRKVSGEDRIHPTLLDIAHVLQGQNKHKHLNPAYPLPPKYKARLKISCADKLNWGKVGETIGVFPVKGVIALPRETPTSAKQVGEG